MNEPCPLLPRIDRPVTAADSRALGKDRGESFYRLCLEYAQTKWMADLPAQALLQLNRSMSADLSGEERVLDAAPIPYAAVAWILARRPDREGQFLGNPRRHWQHYATRMSGPRAELRAWRSWACHAIGSRVLPRDEFPDDERQIAVEAVRIPREGEIGDRLEMLGWPGEAAAWRRVLESYDGRQ